MTACRCRLFLARPAILLTTFLFNLSTLHRLTKAAAALTERGNLLASMHWSLPRPTSKAEQQMGRHMEVSTHSSPKAHRDAHVAVFAVACGRRVSVGRAPAAIA
jgi:hypothetical protein